MSLAAPEEMSFEAAFVCNKSESVLSVIEKCLDNGLGSCLVVGDDRRFIGRISLDDIRRANANVVVASRKHRARVHVGDATREHKASVVRAYGPAGDQAAIAAVRPIRVLRSAAVVANAR